MRLSDIRLRRNSVALCEQNRDNSARMTSLERSISLRTIIWVAYLALALVFVQGVRLHVHLYAHDAAAGHEHQDQVHSGYSDSDEHPDETAQIDLSTQTIAKKLSFESLIIALVGVAIVLVAVVSSSFGVLPSTFRTPFLPWRGCQPPPLRAPPAIS